MSPRHDILPYRAPASADPPLAQTVALYVAVFCATGLALAIVIGGGYELLCLFSGHSL